MSIKINVKEIDLKIEDFCPFSNEKYEGFYIVWSSTIGFGEYTIFREKGSDEWYADSEHMDYPNNKEFITELMKLFIKDLHIE